MIDTHTLVITAKGEMKRVEGFVAKLIVAHPRLAAAAAFVVGAVVGHLI